jgi:hypothetical protein
VGGRFFEFEDLSWFPDTIRQGMTDYLRFLFTATNLYGPVVPLIRKVVENSNERKLVDLCSGGGGPVEQVLRNYHNSYQEDIAAVLTDLYPNINAFKLLAGKKDSRISFYETPVNAAAVPTSLKGIRTIFSGFHHFKKDTAKAVIGDAVNAGAPICIFDGGDRSILIILGILFIHPLLFICCTPFLKPFRLSRIFFTYIIPLIPFCTVWDGIVSIARLYSPKEMLHLAESVSGNYVWESGKVRNALGLNVAYLVGWEK